MASFDEALPKQVLGDKVRQRGQAQKWQKTNVLVMLSQKEGSG